METDIKMTRAWAEIDLAAIRQNYNCAAAHAKAYGAKLIAVVKANAYGHGAIRVAAELERSCGADYFAVATVNEAIELSKSGITSPILILSEIHPSLYSELVLHPNVIPSIFQLESARALSEAALARGVILPYFLAIDTGMSRIGIDSANLNEGLDLAEQIAQLPSLKLEGIFSHYACADHADKTSALHQAELFDAFTKKLAERGIKPTYLSMCNSAALTESAFVNKYDLTREGISLYGYHPSDETERILPLKPAMTLRARVSAVRQIEIGVGVGYGHTFKAERKTRVAILPIGYADGYPRLLSNKGGVIIDGKFAPIIGRVCMDQLMVDVTDIPSAKVGSTATLMGADERVRADRLAQMIGTISYELICGISSRVPRIYVNAYDSVNSD